jgi:hypothetical protein
MEDDGSTFGKPNVGASLLIEGKGYATNSFIGPLVYSLPVRTRFYPDQLILVDVAITIGKQWTWNSGFMIDFSVGIGSQFQNSIDKETYLFDAESKIIYDNTGIELDNQYPNKMRIIIPISLKVGYRF